MFFWWDKIIFSFGRVFRDVFLHRLFGLEQMFLLLFFLFLLYHIYISCFFFNRSVQFCNISTKFDIQMNKWKSKYVLKCDVVRSTFSNRNNFSNKISFSRKNSLKSLLFKNHDQPLMKRRRGNGSAAVPAFEFNTTGVLNHRWSAIYWFKIDMCFIYLIILTHWLWKSFRTYKFILVLRFIFHESGIRTWTSNATLILLSR